MTDTVSFVVHDKIAIWRGRETVSLERARRLVTAVIENVRKRHIRKLLIDSTALGGFASPSIAARHQLVRTWAGASGGALQIAFVLRPEMIDPQRFGVVVARNFGTNVNVFAHEADALAWLRSH